MRDKERIDRILNKLGKVWKKYPNQRLGQLLENYIFFKGERGDKTSFNLYLQRDTETEKILDLMLEEE